MFKCVLELYLLVVMFFMDVEVCIYEEFGVIICGEFMVIGIFRMDIYDIFYYEDSDVWYKCKIFYESEGDGEEGKFKKVLQNFFVFVYSVKEVYD